MCEDCDSDLTKVRILCPSFSIFRFPKIFNILLEMCQSFDQELFQSNRIHYKNESFSRTPLSIQFHLFKRYQYGSALQTGTIIFSLLLHLPEMLGCKKPIGCLKEKNRCGFLWFCNNLLICLEADCAERFLGTAFLLFAVPLLLTSLGSRKQDTMWDTSLARKITKLWQLLL